MALPTPAPSPLLTPTTPGPAPVQTSFVRPPGLPCLSPEACPLPITHYPLSQPRLRLPPKWYPGCESPLTCLGNTSCRHSPSHHHPPPPQIHTCTHTHFCQPCFCQQLLKLFSGWGAGIELPEADGVGCHPIPSPARPPPWAQPASHTCSPPTSGWQWTPPKLENNKCSRVFVMLRPAQYMRERERENEREDSNGQKE